MKLSRIFGGLFSVIIIHMTLATADLSAQGAVHSQMDRTEFNQVSRRGGAFQGAQLVRPSPREREAISEVLMAKPRPKALTDADMILLKELLNKPTWLGVEQRIVHDIWAEVSGKEWRNEETGHPRNKTLP